MRSLAAIVVLAATACTTVPQDPSVTTLCNAADIEKFIGQVATSETGAAIIRATHSSILRWATPGMAMTMEYSASRVTVSVGDDGKIAGVNCG